MINPLSLSVKVAGFLVAGVAFGAGWRLGAYLGDLATGKSTLEWPSVEDLFGTDQKSEPLWKRKFGPIGEA